MSIESKVDKILEKLEYTQIDIAKLHERMVNEKVKLEKNSDKIEELKKDYNLLENEVIKIKHFIGIAKKFTYATISIVGSILIFSLEQVINFFK